MAVIKLQDGCITLEDGHQRVPLSAENIFSVVFEGAQEIFGNAVLPDDISSLGLAFEKYPGDPTVVLRPSDHDSYFTVECCLIAKGIGFEVNVARWEGKFLDYAIADKRWLPLPNGSIQAAQSFLAHAGLTDFGPITLKEYLHILQLRDPVLVVEDRTNLSFSASRLACALQGGGPTGFMGTLYPYQAAGYRWLAFMRKNGIGGIIADEMGLGKTVQVICLLLDSKNDGGVPSLVVTPATLLENWKREILRFAPQLDVYVHRGADRTGFPSDLRRHDVILSSYETAVADVSLLQKITWDLLIIDEAQAIKNPSAKRTRKLKTLLRRCAVAMTGTPVENRLLDLWSITDFVVPSLLGTQAEFERLFPDTMERASALEPILTPIILRRRVADVAKDLPDRIDIPQPLELDLESAEVYETLRASAADGRADNLAALVTLRMFCTHPWLVGQFTHFTQATECSIKFQRLLEIVEEIVLGNGKALIFTSYQQSADLLSRELSARFGFHSDVIDGRTPVPERQLKVDKFSSVQGSAILVLNPKAAGTGLNITAANHVIHFNLEWNPAVEDQASARAHRRGQAQVVTVHRFFYVDTVEDVINDRMKRKRQLAGSAVIGTDGAETDAEDILRAFRVSPINRNRGS